MTQELDDIRVSLKEEIELGETGWLDCFKSSSNKIRFRTLSGIFIQAWQQLTGVNFIFYYGTQFFKNSGITNPFLITIATNVVNVGMTVPGMYAIDRVGRRRMLLIGAAGMCVCEYIVAIVGVTIKIENTSGQKALIAFVCIYIVRLIESHPFIYVLTILQAFFASTWGPIAWVVIGEIFPLNVRAKGMALSAASNWLWNWAIGYATPYLVNPGKGNANLQSKVFFIWGSTCLGCLVFTYFCIPEVSALASYRTADGAHYLTPQTKGLSLEQVDLLYQNTTPIKSVAYRNQLIAHNVHAADHDAIARINSELTGKKPDVEKAEDVSHHEKENTEDTTAPDAPPTLRVI